MASDLSLRDLDTDKTVALAAWFCSFYPQRILVVDLRAELLIAADPQTIAKLCPPIALGELLAPSAVTALRSGVTGELIMPLFLPLPAMRFSMEPENSGWQFACLIPGELGVIYLSTALGDPDVVARGEMVFQVPDELTGLATRGALTPLIAQALARFQESGAACAVLFLDFDRFKRINDKWGHLAGDEVLRRAAAGMQHAIRPGDGAVRYGGDEFVLVISGLHSPDEALSVTQRVAESASKPIPWRGETLRLTASVGVAFSRREDSPESILERADRAMYRAKNLGRVGKIELD